MNRETKCCGVDLLVRREQVAGIGEGEGAPGGPRYDMKYSGEKVLNLGFGSDSSAAAAANPLTWENMRMARPSRCWRQAACQ